MSPTKIIGIVLIKDEDRFIESVLRNIMGFCDLVLVADNGSTDQTLPIIANLAREFPKLQLTRITDLADSHRMIEGYANTPTWIFGVDGDELYEPAGLAILREQLLAGQFDQYWTIFGNVLNCKELKQERGTAKGYLSPPAKSMTKLFNFNRIKAWQGCPQRLHWGRIDFKEPINQDLRICDEVSWAASSFKCLHMVFLPRSSRQAQAPSWRTTRFNPSELRRNTHLDWSLGLKHVLKQLFLYPITRLPWFDYKHRIYGKGPLVEVSTAPFLLEPCREAREGQVPPAAESLASPEL